MEDKKEKKKEICHVCGKEKKPYSVFMNNNLLSFVTHNMAREKGPICKRCDQYFAMTGQFKEATPEEFAMASQSSWFAHTMNEWWKKDSELDCDGDNPRDWEGTQCIASWARQMMEAGKVMYVKPSKVKTESDIREEIVRVIKNFRHVLDGPRAGVTINAPRAVMQINAIDRIETLYWFLGEQRPLFDCDDRETLDDKPRETPVTTENWNRLDPETKLNRVEKFNKEHDDLAKSGIAYGMNDLQRIAIKYGTPTPSKDKKGKWSLEEFK
jgi:hypothetical protein